jgi:uncharacterized membrane protein YpjA
VGNLLTGLAPVCVGCLVLGEVTSKMSIVAVLTFFFTQSIVLYKMSTHHSHIRSSYFQKLVFYSLFIFYLNLVADIEGGTQAESV